MDESGLEHLEYKENLNELHSMMYWEVWFRFAVRDYDPDRVCVCVSASRNIHSQVLETGILVLIFMPQGLRTHTDISNN